MSVAAAKSIEFIVDKEGNSDVDLTGFTGSECTEHPVVKAIENALGTQEEHEKKPEYYQGQDQHLRTNTDGSA